MNKILPTVIVMTVLQIAQSEVLTLAVLTVLAIIFAKRLLCAAGRD